MSCETHPEREYPQEAVVVDAPVPRTPEEVPVDRPPPLQNPVAHLMTGFGTVAGSPGVLFFLIVVSVLLALPLALPVYRSAAENVAPLAAPEGGTPFEFLVTAPRWVFDDWFRQEDDLRDSVASAAAPLLFLASLFGLFVSAGWMRLAVGGPKEHGLHGFVRGGAKHFFAFLRTWVFGLVLFGVLTWFFWGVPGEWLVGLILPGGDPERAASESTARWVLQGREVLYVIGLLGVELVLDLGRASLVAGMRRSAFLAVFRGAFFLLREPLRVLLLVVLAFGIEAALIAGVIALVQNFGWPLWLLVVLLPLVRITLRGARHGGLASLYAESLRSTRRRAPAASPFDDGTAWRTLGDSEPTAG